MSALVTENAPDFTANAVMGDNSFRIQTFQSERQIRRSLLLPDGLLVRLSVGNSRIQ